MTRTTTETLSDRDEENGLVEATFAVSADTFTVTVYHDQTQSAEFPITADVLDVLDAVRDRLAAVLESRS